MATTSRPLPTAIRPHTAAVVHHHRDTSNPDKPLFLLIPGGMIAVMSLLAMIVLGVAAAETSEPAEFDRYARLILLLLPVYFASLLVFCYGYELYDWPRALKRTLWWGILGLAAVLVIAVIIIALRSDADGDSGGGDGEGVLSKLKGAVFSDTSGEVVSELAQPLGEKLISLHLGDGAAEAGNAGPALMSSANCLKCGVYQVLLPNGLCPSCSATRMQDGTPQIGV